MQADWHILFIYMGSSDTRIKVFGHKSPDTDCTCSAILWAWHLSTSGREAKPYVLGTLNKETQFVLGEWGIDAPELLESIEDGERVYIVDTSNPQELFENIGEAAFEGIVDHHKLSGLSTKSPLTVTMMPLASTASVIYEAMGEEKALAMPDSMLGLMLSCILSDTLAFRSPTTTPRDQEIAEKIAQKLDVNIDTYADQMFTAKSDVSEYSDEQLVTLDSKKFEVSGKNLRISSIETTKPELVLARKDGLVSAMNGMVASGDADEVLLFVIDILKEEATVLTYNDMTKQIVEKSFGKKATGDTVVLPGVVSRKKQIIPVLKV